MLAPMARWWHRNPPGTPALTMRSGGGVLPMKHSTLPRSPRTAYCTASLEMMGGPAGGGGLYRNPAGISPHRHHNLRPGCLGGSVHVPGLGDTLTVDKEGDLALTHTDAGDDGFADVLPRVGLGDGFQVQLVAVAQDLDANTAGASGTGSSTPLGTAPQLGHPTLPCWTPFWSR